MDEIEKNQPSEYDRQEEDKNAMQIEGQPYVLWLLKIARTVNASFHRKVRDLLPGSYGGNV